MSSLPPSETSGIGVEICGLSKSFAGQSALLDIHLEIPAGRIFVLMGPSGSGKSVLLRHIIGLESPDTGEIRLDGEPATDAAVRARHRMAMVFQSGGLLNSLTVSENIGLYLAEHQLQPADVIARTVDEKLALVELPPETAAKYPSELSGGMRKRVAIARTFVIDPELVLFDEPTSELDPLVSLTVGREILNLNRRTGATTIIVTHDRDLAFGIADRIAFIAAGRILVEGTPDELRASRDPLLQRFLAADFKTA
ncbi:MAG: ATP-binding cassette domain-containing protein [Pedosphaera sp.]|nr:ATP-binding cassette domain-containing protein [Pedosphaera sp.]